MRMMTRTTRACTIETLDESLRAAIKAHGRKYGFEDIESDILMCCETISVHRKKGFFGGIRTTLSAVYVTPRWLVWADSTDRHDVRAGTVQLKDIAVRDDQSAASYSITPDQGLNITGRHTDKNKTAITFIVLSSEPDGKKFRQVLVDAVGKVASNLV